MPAAAPEDIALAALGGALVDPSPRRLHGTKAKPGLFTGRAQTTLKAAELSQVQGWIEETGEYAGKGKSRVELWRITPAGVAHALSKADVPSLLGDMLAALEDQARGLDALGGELSRLRGALDGQREAVGVLQQRVAPPDVDAIIRRVAEAQASAGRPSGRTEWHREVVAHLEKLSRAGQSSVSLPQLYAVIGKANSLTIGEFHDGLRALVEARRIRLRPWTQPLYKLEGEQYALMWAQEIMFYAERA